MRTEQPELVIDATHPYAAAVTENILQAAAPMSNICAYCGRLRTKAQAEQHLLSEDDSAMGRVSSRWTTQPKPPSTG